ncbi:MAG: hypothetical protein V8S42_04250 [Lachnospiraceae bacterium]
MNENKQVKLFFGVNFGLTLVMGVLMGIGYFLGRDISSFPAAQMLYPAAGVMAVLLAARKRAEAADEVLCDIFCGAGTYRDLRCTQHNYSAW